MAEMMSLSLLVFILCISLTSSNLGGSGNGTVGGTGVVGGTGTVAGTAGNVTGPGLTAAFSVSSESQLRTDLLTNYSSKTRPDGTTTINLVFHLLTINDLDTRTQTFSVSGYFSMVWDDSRLSWNQSDYNNIMFFFADETEVWRPALVVKNAIDDLSVIADSDVPFRITDSGRIFWNPPGIYQTNCDVDITYYPFDTQECSVVVQSWGYNLRELDLAKFGSGVDTSEFSKNGEWDLLNSYSERVEQLSEVDANTYATVECTFNMKRRTTYYGLNIVLPVVVLSLLSALVFTLPPDSGEKMGYSLTVLLALAVFLTLISDRMPTTSKNTSYMGVYLSVVLILNGLSVLLTMLVLRLHFREDQVSHWVNKLTRNILMPLACIQCSRRNVGSAPVTMDSLETNDSTKRKKKVDDPSIWTGKGGPQVVRSDSEEKELSWKDVARVLDAVFFLVFLIGIILVSIIFFIILGSNL